jgi:hypothetical protein
MAAGRREGWLFAATPADELQSAVIIAALNGGMPGPQENKRPGCSAQGRSFSLISPRPRIAYST